MSVRSVAVWGAGGHAKVVIDAIRATGRLSVAAIVAPDHSGTAFLGSPVFASLEALIEGAAVRRFVIAIGDNQVRFRVADQLRRELPHAELMTVVHPSATVAADVELGPGTVVLAGSVMNPGVIAGTAVIVNTASSIDHDAHIGHFASIAPGAVLGGDVRVGERSAISIGATVLHGRGVGADTVVGAGAVVTTDLPAEVVAYGVPARVVRKRRAGDSYL